LVISGFAFIGRYPALADATAMMTAKAAKRTTFVLILLINRVALCSRLLSGTPYQIPFPSKRHSSLKSAIDMASP